MAQMVCGSCRRLLSYQRGAKHVKCSCCQTVNLVLEADQVGQVKCGSCAVLLMYPYGASQVKCSSCQFVTKIEEHNKRPPWSVQQQQGKPTPPKSISKDPSEEVITKKLAVPKDEGTNSTNALLQ